MKHFLLKTVLLASLSMSTLAIHKNKAFAQEAGTFYTAISSNLVGLFPLTNFDATSQDISGEMLETLLERNWDTFEWQSSLANKWEISKDGKQFTFTLDPKAKFWDGTPVTAEDVKFSFDLIFMDGVQSASLKPYYSQIAKAEAISPSQVRFTAKDVYFKNFDVVAGLQVFQKKFYSALYKKDKTMAKADSNRTVMGTGKWQLEKWEDNQRVVLKRNENYWNKETHVKEGRWTADRMYYRIIPDESVEFETFKKGEISYMGLTPKQWTLQSNGPEFASKITKVKTQNKAAVGYQFIGWNNKHPILSDKNVRWALSHIANLPLWIKKFDFDLYEPAISILGPKTEGHNANVKPIPFDLSAARKRLASAGWTKAGPDGYLIKDGKKFEITILYPVQAKDAYEAKLTEFKNQAAKVGVSILLKAVEWTSFTKLIGDRNFDAVTLAWTRSIDGDHKQIWHSDSIANQGSNFVSYTNAEVDKLIEEHRKTMDRAKRVELIGKIEALTYEDQPYTWLTERKFSLYGHQKNILKERDTYNFQIGTQFWKIAPQ